MDPGLIPRDAYNIFGLVSTVVMLRLCVAVWGAAFLVLFIKQLKTSARLFVSGVVLILIWSALGWLNSLIPHAPEGAAPTIGDMLRLVVMLAEFLVGLASAAVPFIIVKKRGCSPSVMLIVMSILGLGFPILLSVAVFLAFKTKPSVDNFDGFKLDVTHKGEEV